MWTRIVDVKGLILVPFWPKAGLASRSGQRWTVDRGERLVLQTRLNWPELVGG